VLSRSCEPTVKCAIKPTDMLTGNHITEAVRGISQTSVATCRANNLLCVGQQNPCATFNVVSKPDVFTEQEHYYLYV